MKTAENRIEIRCPVGPQKLLAKLSKSGERLVIDEHNLMELSCDFCSHAMKKQGQGNLRVIHCFNFVGELVHTMTEPKF